MAVSSWLTHSPPPFLSCARHRMVTPLLKGRTSLLGYSFQETLSQTCPEVCLPGDSKHRETDDAD